MQTTKIKVENRNIDILTENKLIGVVGQDKIEVTFVDNEWTGLHKTFKMIRSDDEVVVLPMYDDEVELTAECYEASGTALIGFFGTLNENEPENLAIASTDYIPIYIGEHAYDGSIPAPSGWDIIIGKMNDIKSKIEQSAEAIEDDKTEVEHDKADVEQLKTDVQQLKEAVDTKAQEIIDYVTNVKYADIKNKPSTWQELVGVSE